MKNKKLIKRKEKRKEKIAEKKHTRRNTRAFLNARTIAIAFTLLVGMRIRRKRDARRGGRGGRVVLVEAVSRRRPLNVEVARRSRMRGVEGGADGEGHGSHRSVVSGRRAEAGGDG